MNYKRYVVVLNDGRLSTIEAPYYDLAIKLAIANHGDNVVGKVIEEREYRTGFFEKVVKSFSDKAQTQEYKGIEKYGQPVNPMDDYDWLDMADDELIDGYKYFVAERTKRDTILKEVINDLAWMTDHSDDELIKIKIMQIDKKLRKLSKNI